MDYDFVDEELRDRAAHIDQAITNAQAGILAMTDILKRAKAIKAEIIALDREQKKIVGKEMKRVYAAASFKPTRKNNTAVYNALRAG